MTAFIDDHRTQYGVEPICRVLPIAPSTTYEQLARRKDPRLRSSRAKRDAYLRDQIARLWQDNFSVYGVRKVWVVRRQVPERQLNRRGIVVARWTVERLMREIGLQGAVRGGTFKTTIPGGMTVRPPDWSIGTSRLLGRTSCGSQI